MHKLCTLMDWESPEVRVELANGVSTNKTYNNDHRSPFRCNFFRCKYVHLRNAVSSSVRGLISKYFGHFQGADKLWTAEEFLTIKNCYCFPGRQNFLVP